MSEIVLQSESLDLQVYFAKAENHINSYTLATVLVSLTDAIKEINRHINPGYEVEVIVVTFDDGSFKAILKTIYKNAKNLFSNQVVQAIVLGIVSNFIYDHFFAQKTEVKIEVTDDLVVVTDGNDRVVIPRIVYEEKKKLEGNEEVKKPIRKSIEAVRNDPSITGFGVVDFVNRSPSFVLDRKVFDSILPDGEIEDEQNQRVVYETCTIEILRAIMRKSNRKWEFVWHGTEISAPIVDETFYKKFADHKIKIAPGDTFEVELKITQRKHEGTSVFVNKSYEVVRVIGHSTPEPKEIELIQNEVIDQHGESEDESDNE